MSSSFNSRNNNDNNNSNNPYISLSSDDFLSEMSQADLAELALWEHAKFDNFDNNQTNIKGLDANFDDQEISVALSPPDMLVRHNFLSLGDQYPIYTYPATAAATTQLQPVIINPSSNSTATIAATGTNYAPIFSAGPMATLKIPKNLIDITKANNGNGSNGGSNNNEDDDDDDDDDDNNDNDGSKNISKNQINSEDAAKLAAEEDKRRRNTAASARFRVKKKLREQALERTAREMTSKVDLLEGKIKELEMENKWLRSLIVEKDVRLLDIGPVDKKQKLSDAVVPNDHHKGNDDSDVALIEQDFKKLKGEKSLKKETNDQTDQESKKIKLKN